jgi:cytidylate kinase
LQQWNNENASHEDALRDIEERDQRDSTRATSPLCAAADAVLISTDSLSPDEVVEAIAQIIESKLSAL